jgi:hypothetical protein
VGGEEKNMSAYREAAEVEDYAEPEDPKVRSIRRRRMVAKTVMATAVEGLISMLAAAMAHDSHTSLWGPWLAIHAFFLVIAALLWSFKTLFEHGWSE